MLKIAIVEDEEICSRGLTEYLEHYAREKNQRFVIESYENALAFLEEYQPDWDICFFDIQMPYLNGMDAAERLRKMDEKVTLIFLTSLAQYALQGYTVDAADYILKPVEYDEFCLKFTHSLRRVKPRNSTILAFQSGRATVRLDVDEIRYLESGGHNVLYHLGGKIIERRLSLREAENELPDYFARCNSCYVVNMRHVDEVGDDSVTVNGEKLKISRPRKNAFLRRLAEFRGDGQ